MRLVKRVKLLQKKIVNHILPVLSASQIFFHEYYYVGKYLSSGRLLLAHLEAFSYIALCKIIRITRWHIPCEFYSYKSARGILANHKTEGGNSS